MDKIRPQHILIVEDNDEDYECTCDALTESANFNNPIHRAKDGKEALAYLSNSPPFTDSEKFPTPGLMLLDLNMPGVDGRAVLQEMRSFQQFRGIPVIVFTTSSDPVDVEACYAMGANSYVQKPATLNSLVAAIQRIKEYWFEIALIPRDTSHRNWTQK